MQHSAGAIVVHYSELGTKKKNRPVFAGVLKRNLAQALEGIERRAWKNANGRLICDVTEPMTDALRDEIIRRIKPVQGIAHFAIAERVTERHLHLLEPLVRGLAVEWAAAHPAAKTFRIDTQRGDKSFRMSSVEVNRLLGSIVGEATGLSVQLKEPDLTVFVEILHQGFVVYVTRYPGECGLPVGCSARVLSLLSSGIDSPVSSHRMMNRGCRVSFVHFHSVPYTSRASVDLARELARILNGYQPPAPLFLVPFADIQREIVARAPSSLRVVLYRRYMLRLATYVAHRVRAQALVTGDSVGQVASQTVENLSIIDPATDLLILRPLVAMSKQEIISQARRLGTYDVSTQPYEDCCSFLMPKNPETHARADAVLRAEEACGDLSDLIRATLDKTEEVLLQPVERERRANPISL